ncbi:MAG: multiheme c-type cytochrome [Planctomycetota bacterium]|jgi:hypothetical protein
MAETAQKDGGQSSLASPPKDTNDSITIFITGNELGAMKPCGCSGGQLGGLDRRTAVFDSVAQTNRLIIDTGSLVETDSPQDLIKFNIIVQALGLLDYDLTSLSEKDSEIAKSLGMWDQINSVVNVISAYGLGASGRQKSFTKNLPFKDDTIAVTVAALNTEDMPVGEISELFELQDDCKAVNLLIVDDCDSDIISSVAEMGIVDCLICPSGNDEPEVVDDSQDGFWIFSVGQLGKYVSRLRISEVEGELAYDFSAIPVTEDLPQAESLIQLYKSYQQIVKEENLLEQYPRFVLSDGLEYAGSESCRICHWYEYDKWSTKAHAGAYATLEKVGSQYDPECVICHVVGMDYQSGFVSEQETPDLKNVGCENCHGPGSEHSITLGETLTTEPKVSCTDCHTPDHSAEYAGNEDIYLEKITHWRQNDSVDNQP